MLFLCATCGVAYKTENPNPIHTCKRAACGEDGCWEHGVMCICRKCKEADEYLTWWESHKKAAYTLIETRPIE